MIREDYLIGWIRRFLQWLAEIAGLVKAEQYQAAIQRIDVALQAMLDLGHDSLRALSDGEIMARLTLGEPTQVVQEKCLMLAALLQQLGLSLRGLNRQEESRDCLLRALHIMLGVTLREENVALPEYAPSVEILVGQLKDYAWPARTYAALMAFFEQSGRYDKAEDTLYSLLETEPRKPEFCALALDFYQRLAGLSDAALEAGGLPRPEVEAGRAEIQSRQSRPPPEA